MPNFVIAVDGPAASGKGTLARRLALHYHLSYLDTGLMYRAVALSLLEKKLPLDDEDIVSRFAQSLDFERLDRRVLSEHFIGEVSSKIAVMGGLRAILVEKQRAFASRTPGAVLDGRDIGTVVCPHAQVKLYIDAESAVRARRRYDEIISKGGLASYEQVLADIERRDARDKGRLEGALRLAKNAHLLDTTKLSIETTFLTACALIDPVFKMRIKVVEQSGSE